MPRKTKADLERELKRARELLKGITACFERNDDINDYNRLVLNKDIINFLDNTLDSAREFLK